MTWLAARGGSGPFPERHYRIVDVLKIHAEGILTEINKRHLRRCANCARLFENMSESLESTALERAAMHMEAQDQ